VLKDERSSPRPRPESARQFQAFRLGKLLPGQPQKPDGPSTRAGCGDTLIPHYGDHALPTARPRGRTTSDGHPQFNSDMDWQPYLLVSLGYLSRLSAKRAHLLTRYTNNSDWIYHEGPSSPLTIQVSRVRPGSYSYARATRDDPHSWGRDTASECLHFQFAKAHHPPQPAWPST
jgi:hypothetical protein